MHTFKNIMVIDDSYFDRLIAHKVIVLSKVADHVELIESAQKGIDYLKSTLHNPSGLPEIIFLDISMPYMDGFGFLEAFRQLPAAIRGKCRIVMLSSSVNPADIKKAEKSVFVEGFIAKPLSREKLVPYLGG
jgi:CheY-like chemotaxis protein